MSSKPFKDEETIKREINNFLKNNRTQINEYAKKISGFFEITCYNYLVKYYEKEGFTVAVKGLQGTEKNKNAKLFKYKLSTSGYPDNFSYFEVSKTIDSDNHIFEIRQNIPISSSINPDDIYMTADIAVVKQHQNRIHIKYCNIHKYKKTIKGGYCYIENRFLQTFFEVKHLVPSPELLLNFTGLVYELMPQSIRKTHSVNNPKHIAPSLMISGTHNLHTLTISNLYSKRYNLNVLANLFNVPVKVYKVTSKINTIGTN